MTWGINRQKIVYKLLAGYGTVGSDLQISSGQQVSNDQMEQRENDPDEEKSHLALAGLAKVDLTLSASDGAFGGAVDANRCRP